MKRLIPRGGELAMFAVLALACAAVVSMTHLQDLALAAFAFPVFVVACWMGMRRSGQWDAIGKQAPVPVEVTDAADENRAA